MDFQKIVISNTEPDRKAKVWARPTKEGVDLLILDAGKWKPVMSEEVIREIMEDISTATEIIKGDTPSYSDMQYGKMYLDEENDAIFVPINEPGASAYKALEFNEEGIFLNKKVDSANQRTKLSPRLTDLTPEERASLKGDKGDQGDSAIWTGEGEPWSGLKNATGQSTTEPMTQKAVTDELRPVKRVLDDFSWLSSKSMHPATASVLKNLTGMQTSLAYPVKTGDKVVVDTSNDGSNQFTVIAYLTTADQADNWSKKASCSFTDGERHLFTWVADADGYVRVCGYAADMDAYIEVGDALATQADLDLAKGRITDLEAINTGKFEGWSWAYGYLHPSSGEVRSDRICMYSNEVSLHKGDRVVVKTYLPFFTTFAVITSRFNATTSVKASVSSTDVVGEWMTKTYTVQNDGELVRVCGVRKDNEDNEYVITAYVELADANVKRAELSEIKEVMKDDMLPDYWKAYLDGRISGLSFATGDDSFLFVTDTHFSSNAMRSIGVVGYMMKNTRIAKTICGGDICDVGAASSTYEKMLITEIRSLDRLAKQAECNGKFYSVRGNHDFYSYNGGMKYQYKANQVVEHMKSITEKLGTHMTDDQWGMYYYFDNTEASLRYIIVDCVHSSDGGYPQIGATQLQWLADTLASTPPGYGIIVVGHFPASPRMAGGAETLQDYFAALRNMMLAANSRASGTVSYTDHETTTPTDVTYDFTSLNANVIMYLNGHTHTDNQSYHEGIPFVSCICDKLGQEAYSPFCEGTSLAVSMKPSNTEKEQAVSLLKIPTSKSVISCVRLGIGFDRHYHVGKQTVVTGGTINLSSLVTTITPSAWTICDLDGVAYSNSVWPYKTDVATISDSGVVTGVAAGEAMAFAEDENHNKEFFHIVVS